MICVYLPTNDGDFNVDFGRDNANLRHLSSLMSDLSLVSADLPFHSSIQYTYMRDDGGVFSWPDHFLCDSPLAGDPCSVSSFRPWVYLSDHFPLACTLHCNLPLSPPSLCLHTANQTSHCLACSNPRDIASYCSLVCSRLPSLPNSVTDCCDPLCTQHHVMLDRFCEQLDHCLHDCALATLPKVRQSSSVPGWN